MTGLHHDEDGFTLIELIIGMMIMMIVSAGVAEFVTNVFTNTRATTNRVNDISEAQKISESLDSLLTSATCIVSAANDVVGGGGNWEVPSSAYQGSCNGPPNQVIIPPPNGSPYNFLFFAPENLPVNTGTVPVAPSPDINTEYGVAFNASSLTVTDLRTGAIMPLGQDVLGVTFTFYQSNPNPGGNCSGSSSGVPQDPNTMTVAVGMQLTMRSSSTDKSGTAYQSCIALPNAL